LSNDELLNILSQASNPRAVQAHLSKLFDGVHFLDFEGEGRSLDVIAMQSVEGERVPLAKGMKARGAVEGDNPTLWTLLFARVIKPVAVHPSECHAAELSIKCGVTVNAASFV
jgi:hypothetical protein